MKIRNNDHVLGIDIGITSVGWAILDKSDYHVVDLGVRLFDENTADNNKTRRSRRGQRRIIRRRRNRIDDLRTLLVQSKIISENFLPLGNPYDLRQKGLSEALSVEELASVLLHLAKRRGSKVEVEEEESQGKEKGDNKSKKFSLKATLTSNSEILRKSRLYVCQFQLQNQFNKGVIRGTYNVFKQSEYQKELETILKHQPLSDSLKAQITNIIFRSRKYSDGPGSFKSPTPYGRYRLINGNVNEEPLNLIELMRGKCSVYPDEVRAPKNSYSAELFDFLSDLNNLRSAKNEKITQDQKEYLLGNFIHKGIRLTFSKLVKYLKWESDLVKGVKKDNSDKPIISDFKGYLDLYNIVKEHDSQILSDKDKVDELFTILTSTKDIEERSEKIKRLYPDENDSLIAAIADMKKVVGYHSLSLKALRIMNKEMLLEPKNHMEIIKNKNLISSNGRNLIGKKNIPFNDKAILSPVAKRAHRQAILVINSLRRKHGEFSHIAIETARDKNTEEEKKRIKDFQNKNKDTKVNIDKLIEGHISPNKVNAKMRLKVRLYDEQNSKCIYTGNPIDLHRLITDPNAYEIEHIIPYSISFDDSLNNKALAEKQANSIKGNNTPYQYFMSGKAYGTIQTYQAYKNTIINNKSLSREKKANLLFEEDLTKYSVILDFVNRNLVDTRYATRSIMSSLKEYYRINEIPTNVTGIRGKITDTCRKMAMLPKDRNELMHHAIDAAIVAASSQYKTINSLSGEDFLKNYYDKKENQDLTLINILTGEIIDDDQYNLMKDNNMHIFLHQLKDIQSKHVKFSYKIDRKPNRQFSDETIYGTRMYDDELHVIKKYKNIYDKPGETVAKIIRSIKKEEEWKKLLIYRYEKSANLLSNPNSTFNILKSVVEMYPDKTNPFAEYRNNHNDYIRKFAKDGKGPVIMQLRYDDGKLGQHIDVTKDKSKKSNKIVLLHLGAYRLDFYRSDTNAYKYRFVTIRPHEVKSEGKAYAIDSDLYKYKLAEKKITDDYSFVFSIYRNDIIRTISSKEEKNNANEFYRFVSIMNDTSNRIEVKPIDRNLSLDEKTKKIIRQMGIPIGKEIDEIEKWYVSPIGEKKKCIKEELKLRFNYDNM